MATGGRHRLRGLKGGIVAIHFFAFFLYQLPNHCQRAAFSRESELLPSNQFSQLAGKHHPDIQVQLLESIDIFRVI